MTESIVAVRKTTPRSVLADIAGVMDDAGHSAFLPRDHQTLIKLNLSWTKYFPACSSEPWQLEGVVRKLLADGYPRNDLIPIENKTVVTDPIKGCTNNCWRSVLDHYDLDFTPLTRVEWEKHEFRQPLLRLDRIFPEGIEIPSMFAGRNVLHLPTVKTHGHSVTTGAIKNAFGGLLKEVRHYAHKHIHEVLVDLVIMQKELHPGVFTVMDGTVCGDGAGPRTMIPRIKNYVLASGDSVAIDAVAAKMMGFEPLEIPYLRMCHERELGCADLSKIEIAGEDVSDVDFGFETKKSFCNLGRPNASQGQTAVLGEGRPAFAARCLGAVCLKYLSRLDLVPDDRSPTYP